MPTDVSFVTGKIGQAGSFNGSSSTIALGAPALLNTPYTTVCLWVKTNDATPSLAMHIFHRRNAYTGTVAIYLWTDGKWAAQIRLDGSESTGRIVYSDNVATTDWTHLAMMYDGDKLKLCVNGILQASIDDTDGTIDTDSYSSIYIGRHPTLSDRYFDGLIDDVRIYNEALSLGPYRCDEAESACTGATAGQDYSAGAAIGQDYHSGTDAGQV